MKPCGDCHADPIPISVDLKTLNIDKLKVALLSVGGMGCQNCATRVRNSVLIIDGIITAHVDLEEETAMVLYDPEKVMPHHLLRAISAAGNDGKHSYWPSILSVAAAREYIYSPHQTESDGRDNIGREATSRL